MAKSFERKVTVTITPKEGEAVTLTGETAASFWLAYQRGEEFITVVDPTTGKRTTYNGDCVCSVQWESAKGDEYVKPDCEPLFCPEPAPDPEPQGGNKLVQHLTKEEWYDRLWHPDSEREVVEIPPREEDKAEKPKKQAKRKKSEDK